MRETKTDIFCAVCIGLVLAMLALAYFDVLFRG